MRRAKSLRIGVHHANAVVWEPVCGTLARSIDRRRGARSDRRIVRASSGERATDLRLRDGDALAAVRVRTRRRGRDRRRRHPDRRDLCCAGATRAELRKTATGRNLKFNFLERRLFRAILYPAARLLATGPPLELIPDVKLPARARVPSPASPPPVLVHLEHQERLAKVKHEP